MTEKSISLKITADSAQGRKALGEVSGELERLGLKQTQVAQAAQQAAGVQVNSARAIKGGIESISQQLDAARTQMLAFLGVQQGMAGVKAITDLADGYKDLRARIGLVVGEGEALASAMDKVQGVALRTNSSLEETGNLFARITKAGKDAGLSAQDAAAQSLQLTETINQSIQLGGASADASKAAITQLIQGLQGGVLRGDEFNSVMEQAPRLAQAMADGLGVTTGELRRMANEGQLTSATVIEALQKQSTVVAAEFEKVPKTVARAMTNVHTAWQRYLADTDEAHGYTARAAGAIDLLAENLGTLADVMLHAGTTFGAWKALNMAQTWVATKLAVEQETAATVANTAAKGAGAVAATGAANAARTHAVATQASAQAQTQHAIASRAASAAIAAQRLELEASRAAQAAAAASTTAAGATAAATTGKLGALGTAFGAVARSVGPLLALDIALNFRKYGTWIGEAAAKLMGYKDRSAELAEQEKLNQRIAEESAAMRRELALKTQEAINKQFELSKAANGAVSKFDELTLSGKTAADAVGEVTKNFDLTKLSGITDFAATLDKLGAAGKLNAQEIKTAWADALDGQDLLQFETMARAAFTGSAREAERLAQLTDALLREAVQRTGVDYDNLQGKIGAAARSAINDTDQIIGGLDRLSAQGVDTGRALQASLSKAINAADSQQAIDAVRGQIESVRHVLGDKLADGFLDQAAQKARELGDELDRNKPGINSLREAFKELGMTSREELGKTAQRAQDAYATMIKAGQQEGESYVAWQERKRQAAEVMIQRMVAANGGIADAAIQARAAQEGVKLTIDEVGRATVNTANLTRSATGEMSGGWRDVAGATREATEAAREHQRQMLQKYGRPGEGEDRRGLGEGVQRVGTDGFRNKDGWASDAKGNAIGQTKQTWLSIYNMVKGMGLSDEQARGIADQAYPNGQYSSGLQRSMMRHATDSIDVTEAARRAAEKMIREGGSAAGVAGANNSGTPGAVAKVVRVEFSGKSYDVDTSTPKGQQALDDLLRDMGRDKRRAA